MKLHKTDLFCPLMTEFEVPEHFWPDEDAMTSSVKIFKKLIFFGIFALPIKIFCQNYFYSDSGFIGFNLMYHVTISII